MYKSSHGRYGPDDEITKTFNSLKLNPGHYLETFDDLEKSAKAAQTLDDYATAAQIWKVMGLYGVEERTSKYYASYGIILDFGAVVGAERDKQKEIQLRKEMGLKGAAENFFMAQDYSQSGKMWDRLKEHRYQQDYKSLTLDEARKAAHAYQLVKNPQKEFDYRYLVISKSNMSEDTLEWVEVLWRFRCQDPDPNIACWEVMECNKESNPEIYKQAFELFQTNNPKRLKQFMDRKQRRHKVDAELEQRFNSLKIEPETSFEDIFKTLEASAKSAHSDGKNVEEAQYWEAMGYYADAIQDDDSKFFIKSQEGTSHKEINKAFEERERVWAASVRRKEDGFTKALKAYSLTNNYPKISVMWDELSKFKLLQVDDLRAAVEAHQQAGNLEKEINFRFKLKKSGGATYSDLLALAKRLWEAELDDNSEEDSKNKPENICWKIMKTAKKYDYSELYNQAYELFTKHNSEMLTSFIKSSEEARHIQEEDQDS